jgi:formylglycine-generating enzyme required for sulfatase activity
MLTLTLMLLFAPAASAVVTIDWVTVGAPGNACETQTAGCFGAVAYEYRISQYEVTNAQYAAFLNAVAEDDTYGLYNPSMGSGYGGIIRNGSSGSLTYSTIAGRENMPVSFVSFYDSLRFVNWLHNGQPIGAQGDATTQDGAYTISQTGIDDNTISRNPGATVFLTSDDEWYKAAYYDANSEDYFDYPAGSDTQTACAALGATPNTANCWPAVLDLTEVGSYTNSASPNGSFDQGGNVWEWNEAIVGSRRGLRGGEFGSMPSQLAASVRLEDSPVNDSPGYGFRVASPASAPAVPSFGPLGLALFGGLLGIGGWRRLHA